MRKPIIGLLLFSILISGCGYTIQQPDQIEIVSPNKTIVHPLQKNAIITVQGKISEVTIEIQNRQVRITQSECPDKICIKTGWIKRWHEFILCAPNQVSIRFRSIPGLSKYRMTY